MDFLFVVFESDFPTRCFPFLFGSSIVVTGVCVAIDYQHWLDEIGLPKGD